MKKINAYIATSLLTAFILSSQMQANAHTGSTQPVKKIFNQAVLADTAISMNSAAANLLNSSGSSMKDVKKAAREFKQFNRVTRNFAREFNGASDVYWSKDKSNYCSQFSKDGLRQMAWYGPGGEQIASMITYDENLLPADVRKLVSNAYRGYSIRHTNEIRKGDVLVHVVTIENDKNIKQIRICNGEMDEYKAFRKG